MQVLADSGSLIRIMLKISASLGIALGTLTLRRPLFEGGGVDPRNHGRTQTQNFFLKLDEKYDNKVYLYDPYNSLCFIAPASNS